MEPAQIDFDFVIPLTGSGFQSQLPWPAPSRVGLIKEPGPVLVCHW